MLLRLKSKTAIEQQLLLQRRRLVAVQRRGLRNDTFARRHLGPSEKDVQEMLKVIGCKSLDEMAQKTVPAALLKKDIFKNLSSPSGGGALPQEGVTETEALEELKAIAAKNKLMKNYIGMGYYGTKTPGVILRNLIENHQWVSSYTPYQAHISQGRLEMLLNFQTVVSDLTKLPVANCSLLDEGSAAAESVAMCMHHTKHKRNAFFISENCHPQTIGVVATRCKALGVELVIASEDKLAKEGGIERFCGVMVQYPDTLGRIRQDHFALAVQVKKANSIMVVATDLLSLTMLKPPGEWGADIVLGSAQRFGVPLFYGGPHAGFMSTTEEMKRLLPGRIIGVSIDAAGNPALRMALQAREQFIRREKALSNICTAQALLANVAASYAIYHGPQGLKEIAQGVRGLALKFNQGCLDLGLETCTPKGDLFDTVTVDIKGHMSNSKLAEVIVREAKANVRVSYFGKAGSQSNYIGVSVDETTTEQDVDQLLSVIAKALKKDYKASSSSSSSNNNNYPSRTSEYMTHPVFNSYHSETNLNRYLAALESKDISLRQSMIPLGSCTMKLNAASELIPVSWPEFANMHPFQPAAQAKGYAQMIDQLNDWLAEVTGFAAVSAQPNSGATGEYAGLLAIIAYHASKKEGHRKICLIPASAHGTNPASAVLCGMQVVGVKNDENGNVDLKDLQAKAELHQKNLGAVMITYPSTYGKFEEGVKEACDIVHKYGGQVYMDGANLNAQLGMTSPGSIGADVCHLNLHKTFAIPHGGGGPGVGAIGVAKHLAPFLPGHAVIQTGGTGKGVKAKSELQVSAAPFGSAGILQIPWMFIRMMGAKGLLASSQIAILNANYMAKRLEGSYKVLFRSDQSQMCAHEFIIDMKQFKTTGITEDDVARRLADYGFHAPTMSWPVPGTLMVEPTESEDKAECDRFVDAMLSIREEIRQVEQGKYKAEESPLHNSPHTAQMVMSDKWNRKYTRQEAAFPAKKLPYGVKYWPTVTKVDALHGDRNLVCTCPPVDAYSSTS